MKDQEEQNQNKPEPSAPETDAGQLHPSTGREQSVSNKELLDQLLNGGW